MQGLYRPAGRVVRGFDRQIAGDTGDGADAHQGLVDPAQAHAVADGLYRVAQDIEANADVGDRGRRESGDVGKHYR